MTAETDSFIQFLRTGFSEGKLLKCTLSKPLSKGDDHPKNIYIRAVELKKGPHLAFNYRYPTRDEVKNYDADTAVALLTKLLGAEWLQADLLTTEADWSLTLERSGKARLLRKAPTHTQAASTAHDRSKKRLLEPGAPWLHTLGITNARGEVLAQAQDKWRQINKYLEIIDSLLNASPLPLHAEIADMGSGKGYLSFALYEYLVQQRSLQPRVTGIELRPKLVELCNRTARENHFDGLHFVAEDIRNYQPERLDMLIALHACDTATDLALAAGIARKAAIIVAAPCCHKQIRQDMATRNELAPILQYGILEERQAEIVTDGIRALLLEAEGYQTKVFEFISTEHTAKNVMITATKSARKNAPGEPLRKVEALKTGFGIRQHYLEKLLEEANLL